MSFTDMADRIVEIGGFKIRVDPSYAEVIVRSFETGGYESRERAVMPVVLKPGDRVLELGTATGLVSMVCASIVGHENIVSFEANPEMARHAALNYVANGIQVRGVNAFCKNRRHFGGPGSVETFYVHHEFWASNASPTEGKVPVIVPCLCLETELAIHGANVIVCDIEGGEIDLLTDADLSTVTKIIVEIHNWAGRERINLMMARLITQGFCIDFDLSAQSVIVMHRGLVRNY